MKWPWSRSLSQRVLWGYYVFLGIFLVAALMQWWDLSKLQWRIAMHDITGELLEEVLDIRRYEKNWFLYGDPSDFSMNSACIAEVRRLIKLHRQEFNSLPSAGRYIQKITRILDEYEGLMISLREEKHPKNSHYIEGRIRDVGRELESTVHNFRAKENNQITKTLRFVTSSTIIFGVIAVFIVFIMGSQLASSVVRPLQQIVKCTEKIARGEFKPCETPHEVEEIRRVHEALSTMMVKLEEREREVVQSQKMAAIGTLVAGVAHELNNPLSNIGTSAEILLEEIRSGEDPEAETEREFWEEMLLQIIDQVDRAKRIVRSLLEFSRDKEPDLEPLSLGGFLEETRSLLPEPVKSGMLTTEVLEDGTFLGDRQRLQQVLLNLIENAVHAVKEKGEKDGKVEVMGFVDDQQRQVIIKVRDNGPGIPPDLLENIFDPFFTTKDIGEGSGLGLAIAQEIVTKHHGTLKVESEMGKGTVFTIILPQERHMEVGQKNG